MDGALGGCSHTASYARSSGYLNSDALFSPHPPHFSLSFILFLFSNAFLSTVGALHIHNADNLLINDVTNISSASRIPLKQLE